MKEATNLPEFMSIKEFANLLKVHENTIRNGIKGGRICAIRISASPRAAYRIPVTELNRLAFNELERVIEKLIDKKIK